MKVDIKIDKSVFLEKCLKLREQGLNLRSIASSLQSSYSSVQRVLREYDNLRFDVDSVNLNQDESTMNQNEFDDESTMNQDESDNKSFIEKPRINLDNIKKVPKNADLMVFTHFFYFYNLLNAQKPISFCQYRGINTNFCLLLLKDTLPDQEKWLIYYTIRLLDELCKVSESDYDCNCWLRINKHLAFSIEQYLCGFPYECPPVSKKKISKICKMALEWDSV